MELTTLDERRTANVVLEALHVYARVSPQPEYKKAAESVYRELQAKLYQ